METTAIRPRARKRRVARVNSGQYRKGSDPRRHVFTREECSQGGLTTARRYLCTGRWHLDWWDRCDRKIKTEGGYEDAEEETDRPAESAGRVGGDDRDIPF